MIEDDSETRSNPTQETRAAVAQALLKILRQPEQNEKTLDHIVRMFLAKDIDLSTRDDADFSALALASLHGYESAASTLCDAVVNDKYLTATAKRVIVLQALGVARTPHLVKTLGVASEKLHRENPVSANSFFDEQSPASPNDLMGEELISIIVRHNEDEVLIIEECANLLSRGASLRSVDEEGRSALEWAARKQFVIILDKIAERLDTLDNQTALAMLLKARESSSDNDVIDGLNKHIQPRREKPLTLEQQFYKDGRPSHSTNHQQGVKPMSTPLALTAPAMTEAEKLGHNVINTIINNRHGDDEITISMRCRDFIKQGADLNVRSANGLTAYEEAFKKGFYGLGKMIISMRHDRGDDNKSIFNMVSGLKKLCTSQSMETLWGKQMDHLRELPERPKIALTPS